ICSLSFLLSLYGDGLIRSPSNFHFSTALGLDLRGGCLQVLADDLKLSPCFEVDEISRDHPGVGDILDRPLLDVKSLGRRAVLEDRNLLGAHGEPLSIALEQVRDADEACDECVLGPLVDL